MQHSSEPPSSAPLLPSALEGDRRAWRKLKPRLGIGGRLALGLAAVGVVIFIGHGLASQTTRQASEAVRRMQSESEPLARRANAVLEKLVAYDRSISEYLQGGRSSDFRTIIAAGVELQGALTAYYEGKPAPALTPAARQLRVLLADHIAKSEQLAKSAAQRAQWVDERNTALEHVYHYIASAGGAGLAINGTQVVAQRSLSELEVAIASIRGNFAPGPVMARREQDFSAVLSAHTPEL